MTARHAAFETGFSPDETTCAECLVLERREG